MNEAKYSVEYFGSIGFQCPDLSNPADFFMSMMSIESIEQDTMTEKGSVLINKNTIEDQYRELIELLVTKYHESEYVNDHKAVHPECHPIEDRSAGEVVTSFGY